VATEVRSDITVQPVGDVTAVLGEGPYWLPGEFALLWVDIPAGLLHRTEVPSGETVTTELGQVSAVFPTRAGGLLYAAGHQLVLRETVPGQPGMSGDFTERVIAAAPPHPELRFNDGAVDPSGRVWIGSMHTVETDPLGTLYRLDPGAPAGAVLTAVAPGATVSNGLGWSPDGSRLYYADSPTRRVDMFDYDPVTGEATGRRVLADLSGFDGVPDGLTVDGDGYVWVCMWDGGVLRRLAPSGALDAVVPVPVAKPTSVAFGGADLADLYVTTARIDLTAEQLASQPLAGRLLHLRPGPVGLPATTTQAIIPE
jgi:sugar lactone lactonase YvrE